MWASGYGKNDAVTLLLNAGADANIQDDRGQNALMRATSAGYVDVVTQLLNPQSKVSAPSTSTCRVIGSGAYKTVNCW